jgi:hypothetical protein
MAETGGIRAGYPAWIRVAMEPGVGTVSSEVEILAVAARGASDLEADHSTRTDGSSWPAYRRPA